MENIAAKFLAMAPSEQAYCMLALWALGVAFARRLGSKERRIGRVSFIILYGLSLFAFGFSIALQELSQAAIRHGSATWLALPRLVMPLACGAAAMLLGDARSRDIDGTDRRGLWSAFILPSPILMLKKNPGPVRLPRWITAPVLIAIGVLSMVGFAIVAVIGLGALVEEFATRTMLETERLLRQDKLAPPEVSSPYAAPYEAFFVKKKADWAAAGEAVRAADQATRTPADAANERAPDAADEVVSIEPALTAEGFDADRVMQLIEESAGAAAQKTALRALVDTARENTELRAFVLEQVRAALQ